MTTVADLRESIPRLRKGDGIAGPEYFGCVNSGVRPVLRRLLRTPKPTFLVGSWFAVDTAITEITLAKLGREVPKGRGLDTKIGTRRIVKGLDGKATERDWVYVFSTKKAAVEKFLELSGEVLERNAEARWDKETIRKKAEAGDLGAFVALSTDY